MIKNKGRWIAAAISLCLVGVIVFVGGMTMLGWNFEKLSVKTVTNTHMVDQEIKGISIKTQDCEVELVPADKISVVCHEREKAIHTVKVEKGVLLVQIDDDAAWYDKIGLGFSNLKITVSIPKGDYEFFSLNTSTGDVVIPKGYTFNTFDIKGSTCDIKCGATLGNGKIDISTGDINLNGASAKDLKLSLSTGDIKLRDVKCKSLTAKSSTGDVELEKVMVDEKLAIKASTGDVKLKDSDAGELYITLTTGDVKGNLLSDKVFIVSTGTGKIDVPKTVNGGRCEITTSTGDVKITITKK